MNETSFQQTPFLFFKNSITTIKAIIILASILIVYGQDISVLFSNAMDFRAGNIANYVIVIPFLIAYLIYRKRHTISDAITSNAMCKIPFTSFSDIIGIGICVFALGLFVAGSSTFYVSELHLLSLVVFTTGSVIFLFNLKALKKMPFVFVLLAFMIPIPGEMINSIAMDMTPTVTVAVDKLLYVSGINAILDTDSVIPQLHLIATDETSFSIMIAEPSSGIYSIITFAALGTFVFYLLSGPVWRRSVLFVMGFPLMFLLNIARIYIMTVLWYYFGEDVSESFHVVSGSVMIAIGTCVLLVVGQKILHLNLGTVKKTKQKSNIHYKKSIFVNKSLYYIQGFTNISQMVRYPSFKKDGIRVLVLLAIILMTYFAYHYDNPSYASSDVLSFDPSTIFGKESNILLPELDGWDLEFYSRYWILEKTLRHDLWIMFKYVANPDNPLSAIDEPEIYTGVHIGDYSHRLESSLTWSGRTESTILQSEEVSILDNVTGKFLAYQKPDDHQIYVVLYTIEKIPVTVGSNVEDRYVHVLTMSNTEYLAHLGLISELDDYESAKSLLASMMEPIAVHWQGKSIQYLSDDSNVSKIDEQYLQSEPTKKKISGIAFGPHRNGQSPHDGAFPSQEDIENDIRYLSDITERIRVYGVSAGQEYIVQMAQKYGLKVTLTAWLDENNPQQNTEEIQKAVDVAKKYPHTIESIIVGNDVLIRGIVSDETLIEHIKKVKNQLQDTNIQVTVSESWEQWIAHPKIYDAVDYVMIHVYPYWMGKNVDSSAKFVYEIYDMFQGPINHDKKRVVIGETGWPSAGKTICDAVASPENQRIFIQELQGIADSKNIEYFFFEAFDEKWKKDDPLLVSNHYCLGFTDDESTVKHAERNWGLFNANGTMKHSLIDILPTTRHQTTRN